VHATCGADRRSPKSQGAPSRRPFQPGRINKSRKRHGLRAPCKKTQGALRRCSAAGHSARAYVTGCKATIGVCHGKTKAACHVSCRPALPARAGERLGDDLCDAFIQNAEGKGLGWPLFGRPMLP
jgi:hypothetical protein